MTDQAQPGASASAADKSAPAAPAGSSADAPASQAFGTFGAARGSGLLRGKRSSTPSAAPAAAPQGEYKPTALEVIVPEREYKNPFGETTPPAPPPPVAAPVEPARAQEVVSAPTPPPPVKTEAPVEKPSLNILPPAETKRSALNWENPAAGTSAPAYPAPAPRENRRDERPTFRPEPRRDQRPEGGFEPRREPRPEAAGSRREGFEPRREREPFRAPAPAAPKKSPGFFGWLKDLFSGKKPASETPVREPEHGFDRDRDREGQGHRRRHRGGRGRHFDNRGGQPRDPRDEEGGETRFQGGERQGGQHDGNRPRRHRGGRGRGRGDRGGDGPRAEGQQGGGAI